MAEKINWNFVAQALKGPSITGVGSLDVESYEKIDFKIPKTLTHDVTVSDVSKVSLLIISTITPDKLITFKGNPVLPIGDCELDNSLILVGNVAQDFLKADTVLTFTNGTDKEIEIQMLIGRNAI